MSEELRGGARGGVEGVNPLWELGRRVEVKKRR